MVVKLYNTSLPSPGRMKMRRGNAPAAAQSPVTFAELHDVTDSTIWRLTWLRASIGSPAPGKRHAAKETDTGDWLQCKLHVEGIALGKVNFWVCVNIAQCRVSSRWDARALRDFRPQLHDAIVRLLTHLKAEQVHQDEFSAYAYMVRPEGEGYLVTERPSAALLAKQMQDTLSEQLAALPIGGTLTVPDVAAATAALRGRPYANDFGGIRDLITGEIAVTRHKVTLEVTK